MGLAFSFASEITQLLTRNANGHLPNSKAVVADIVPPVSMSGHEQEGECAQNVASLWPGNSRHLYNESTCDPTARNLWHLANP
jgi:hypothetical protein